MFRRWMPIVVGFLALVIIAAVCVRFDKHLRQHYERQKEALPNTQRLLHQCRVTWGDSEYYDICARGEKIIPRSGMV